MDSSALKRRLEFVSLPINDRYVNHVDAENWNRPAYGPFTAAGLYPDSQTAICRSVSAATAYSPAYRSISALISATLTGIGVGVAVGVGVGVGVSVGVGTGVGVGVAVGTGVGVGVLNMMVTGCCVSAFTRKTHRAVGILAMIIPMKKYFREKCIGVIVQHRHYYPDNTRSASSKTGLASE